METNNKDLWVFIETDPNGCPKNVGLELLNPGKRLAQGLKGSLVAVILGKTTETAQKEAEKYGADKIIILENPIYEHYTNDAFTAGLVHLVEKYQPTALMIGATNNGRDLAPRVACRLQTGLTADCTILDINEETGIIGWTRPALGGNLLGTILCADHSPQMGTVRPGVFKKPTPTSNQAQIIKEGFAIPENEIRTKILEIKNDVGSNIDLEGAEIIVAGGRGVGSAEGFQHLQKFADAIGGTLAASRAAVEEGWITSAHQVGQTGKNVSPKVYFAFGISGAIQHTVGMGASEKIIAIDKDPNAPIFEMADYGIVGDLFEVLEVLTEEFAS